MTPLSVVMIVKNESAGIRRCLDSLAWAEEIVVLDTGSSDSTPQICRELGARVHHLDKWEGFGKAKQAAVELATNAWVLSIDADEVLDAQLQRELQQLRERDFEGCAWRLKRMSYYLGRAIRFCGWQNDAPLRLFDSRQGSFSDKLVHEGVKTSQTSKTCLGLLHHYTYPTRQSHFARMQLYGDLAARQMQAAGKTSGFVGPYLRAVTKFVKMFFFRLGFLDGPKGFLLCADSAWGVWYKYDRLARIVR